MQKKCIVTVNNITDTAKKYVVARLVDGALWYYASWETEEKAQKQADTSEDFIVVEN